MVAQRRYELLVAFAVLAGTLLVASLAWACTLLVGSTQTTTPTGGFDDPVHAVGEVTAAEDLSPICPEDGHCDYNLIIVDPDDVTDSDAGGAGSPSCHYDTHEYGVADSDPSESLNTEDTLVLEGNGEVPRTTEHADETGDDSMGTGETVMCFASSYENPDQTNQQNDGPATATQPVPFLLIN